MRELTKDSIKHEIADSPIVYTRGENLFALGNFYLKDASATEKSFNYFVDGNYGDYEVSVTLNDDEIVHECTCLYPNAGCKHTVAVCLDILSRRQQAGSIEDVASVDSSSRGELCLEEIKNDVLENRKRNAKDEQFEITLGETYKGEHLLVNAQGKEYTVTLHEPDKGEGHCTCPDYNSNLLGTCKHLIHLVTHVKKKRDFSSQSKKEKFPFVHIFWDSQVQNFRYFFDRKLPDDLQDTFDKYFTKEKFYRLDDPLQFFYFLEGIREKKNIRVDEEVYKKLDNELLEKELEKIKGNYTPDYSLISTELYPYQKQGVDFALYKKSAIIADEMGLGKTVQAIALSLFKRNLFNFEKVLIICPASLKDQWKREIERFTREKALIIGGTRENRQMIYSENRDYFKITNYEAVLRDILAITRFKPDLLILDEAQRIKNFETKTHQAILSIPHKQSLVITGTPLENKLEDLYSIVQFADPTLLTPLWNFAANHFILKSEKKNKVFGYKNLGELHEKLKDLVIRRKKEEVLKDLPEKLTNNYYIDLTQEQLEIHQGYARSLMPLLNKKFLTPMDVRRIQELLTSMRMVCNSTYLIDRKTNLSPKLRELEGIIHDLIIENKRKVVIFSEWTTMTFLIGKVLSDFGIPFVEFTGKVPVTKRPKLIQEFNENPACKVFLSTDAGGVGLNLQSADCVINFELPWNPAKLNQRVGRVLRIGQKSAVVNVLNLIAKNSIEERIFAGINLKQELFDGVFDGACERVEFSQEKKAQFINKIREMLQEEPIPPVKELPDFAELPESTPHFLNPQVLAEKQIPIAEEEVIEDSQKAEELGKDTAQKLVASVPPQRMEEVLNKGMQFLSGLMSIATGKPLDTEEAKNSLSIDHTTGEVTMKFKLPGFKSLQ